MSKTSNKKRIKQLNNWLVNEINFGKSPKRYIQKKRKL